jgi:hypothetical protein
MTVRQLINLLTLYAERNPDVEVVLDRTAEAPSWAEQVGRGATRLRDRRYPEVLDVSRLRDGRIVLR